VERLEEHARSLAAAQPVTPKAAKGNPLGDRLVENEALLLHAYRTIAKAILGRVGTSATAHSRTELPRLQPVSSTLSASRSLRRLGRLGRRREVLLPLVFAILLSFVLTPAQRADLAW
jgi:cyclic beta-1,2-glucan synthetase